ncbi:carbonic anhydrase [Candidatus Pelagibacter sp.]|nr:carbonic anhydrase [Candidatus Pelagibacter sp.]
MKKKYKAMVLSCMDPRFQTKVSNYLKRRKLNGKYSAFTIAGAAVGVTASKFKKWHSTFWENLNTSIKIHKIEKLIVINHKDCGAAKIVNGKKEFTPQNEMNIHENSFEKIKLNLKKKHPRLKVEFSLMSLNGRIDKF